MNPPTTRRGFLVGADPVNTHETVSAPVKRVDIELDGLTQEELSEFINALRVIQVDRTSDQGGIREDHAKMYMPMLVKMKPGAPG